MTVLTVSCYLNIGASFRLIVFGVVFGNIFLLYLLAVGLKVLNLRFLSEWIQKKICFNARKSLLAIQIKY